MGEFRRWMQTQITRLDGARERKIIGLGAAVVLLALGIGPNVLQALATTAASFRSPIVETSHPPTRAASPVLTQEPVLPMPLPDEPTATNTSETAPTPPILEQPATLPKLSYLFPQAGTTIGSPVNIAVRITDATTVAMLFEVQDPAGQTLTTLSASTVTDGKTWSALFDAEPGTYVLSARATLVNGFVHAFSERRAFLIDATAPSAAPVTYAPSVELTAPDARNTRYAGAVPLGARVKNIAPDQLVFLVTSDSGEETVVLGTELPNGGYWSAMFEGPDGAYRIRARATIGEREMFSPEQALVIASLPR